MPTYPTGDVATYQYDSRGRPVTLTSSAVGKLISGATYTPLDQPATRTFGNGVVQTWGYSTPLARLTSVTVSGNALARSYGYDAVGNITSMSQSQPSSSLWSATFGYDQRDRLTSWVQGATNESYAYTPLGNLTSKAGVAYSYPAAGAARPHTPTLVGGSAYSYDANGNLLSGGGRSYVWTGENRPERVITSSGTETYSYDADGQRMRRGALIDFEGGLIEETAGAGTMRTNYMFNGQAVAVREPGAATALYLHGDQLGSISVTTGAGGTVLARQEFDPWGKIRSGGVTQTKRNYTGQYLDGTGLLFYNARYYDPSLGRFISADTIAPGFANPQNRNRYSYALNNPLKYTDPTGHCVDDPNGIEPSCDQVINNLKQVDILVGDPTYWLREELAVILEGTNDFMKWAGWDAKEFRGEMGRINLERKSEMTDDKGNTAETWTFGVSSKIDFYAGAFGSDRDWTKATVVHELSHVWDGLTQRMSTGMTRATGSVSSGIPFINESYIPKGAIARGYAGDNQREDWAESVAAMVYPGEYNAISKERQSYVRDSIREVRAKR